MSAENFTRKLMARKQFKQRVNICRNEDGSLIAKVIVTNMQSQIKIQSKLSAPSIIHKGVQQGDAMACLLFNITLEYAIRKSGIQTRGTVY